jgi:drug/metabolite transporter (DMT)-like permease
MSGARFIIAGTFFYVLLRLAGTPPPNKRQWQSAFISGLLLFLGGNGLICWALLVVPSSIVALLVTITPLWMTLLPWFAGRTERPRLVVFIGILLGFSGIVLLIGAPSTFSHQPSIYLHLSVIVVATILWAAGSLAAKAMPLPASPWMSSAAQMLCGGVALTAVGFAFGERVEVEVITMQSWMAFIYLTMIGSIAGFGTYVFLLNNTTMARVSTYAFVNPIVAVALGYFIADEPIGPRTVMAGALIIIAVVLILYRAPVPTLRASVRQTA